MGLLEIDRVIEFGFLKGYSLFSESRVCFFKVFCEVVERVGSVGSWGNIFKDIWCYEIKLGDYIYCMFGWGRLLKSFNGIFR